MQNLKGIIKQSEFVQATFRHQKRVLYARDPLVRQHELRLKSDYHSRHDLLLSTPYPDVWLFLRLYNYLHRPGSCLRDKTKSFLCHLKRQTMGDHGDYVNPARGNQFDRGEYVPRAARV